MVAKVDYKYIDRGLSQVDWDVDMGKNSAEDAVLAFMDIISSITARNTIQIVF